MYTFTYRGTAYDVYQTGEIIHDFDPYASFSEYREVVMETVNAAGEYLYLHYQDNRWVPFDSTAQATLKKLIAQFKAEEEESVRMARKDSKENTEDKFHQFVTHLQTHV